MTIDILYFKSSWCGACPAQSSQLDILKSKVDVNIKEYDVDDSPNEARFYKIKSLPTIIVFSANIEVSKYTSLTKAEDILKDLTKWLNQSLINLPSY
jgi:thiol-disulfide isomerase/thioredoxin